MGHGGDPGHPPVEDRFALGRAVLLNEFPNALNIMKRIGVGTQVPKEAYKDWPIFREFRKTADFLGCYRQIFGEEFAAAQDSPEVSYTFKWDFKPKVANPPVGVKPN